MGDTTSCWLEVRSLPIASSLDDERPLQDLVADLFDSYIYDRYHRDGDATSVTRAGRISLGGVEEVAGSLDKLMEQCGVQFAYYCHDDPGYEWLGDGYLYVPDNPPLHWQGAVDADGGPILQRDTVIRALDETTDEASLRSRLEHDLGREAFAAWEALDTEGNSNAA